MVLVYCHDITARVHHAFDFVFREALGVDVEVTDEKERFLQFEGPRVNYSEERLENEFWIRPADLLFETDIYEFEVEVFRWEGNPVFFRTDEACSFPFDPFAAIFYCISRYEEYLHYVGDLYDRFRAHESLAYKHGFLQEPLVDRWCLWIRDRLEAHHPDHPFPEREYSYISTIDVDNAYAFCQKGMMRTLGGYLRSFLALDIQEIKDRTRVLLGLDKDPYDTYEHQLDIQERYGLELLYFFLLADYGYNDKNVPYTSDRLRSLIKHLGDHARLGIHPSFNSNRYPEKLRTEIGRLADISKREVIRSRQHFLILDLPYTYRRLLDLGIQREHSMGFAAEVGFRACTATPFFFYDLEMEQVTKMKVYPFMVMEATLKYYMEQSPDQALSTIKRLIASVKEVGGTFISLWHNESLSEHKQWKGWSHVYEEMVKEAVADKDRSTDSS
jgi:hypothetical protein